MDKMLSKQTHVSHWASHICETDRTVSVVQMRTPGPERWIPRSKPGTRGRCSPLSVRIQRRSWKARAGRSSEIQLPETFPVPHSLLPMLRVSGRLLYARRPIGDCGNLASASSRPAGMQLSLNGKLGDVSVPRLGSVRAAPRPRGCCSSWENPGSGCFRKRLTCQVSV